MSLAFTFWIPRILKRFDHPPQKTSNKQSVLSCFVHLFPKKKWQKLKNKNIPWISFAGLYLDAHATQICTYCSNMLQRINIFGN